jgi:hypothetical protein
MARTRGAVLLACLAAMHLAWVSAFVWTGFAEASDGPFHRALRTYRDLTGILRDYRFFAPAVASDLRAGFLLDYPDGSTEFQPLVGDSQEVRLRYHSLIASSMRNAKYRDLLARSWAAVMLSNHPEASRVTVFTQTYDLPSMEAFARGERPRWRAIYAATFDRSSR